MRYLLTNIGLCFLWFLIVHLAQLYMGRPVGHTLQALSGLWILSTALSLPVLFLLWVWA